MLEERLGRRCVEIRALNVEPHAELHMLWSGFTTPIFTPSNTPCASKVRERKKEGKRVITGAIDRCQLGSQSEELRAWKL